MNSLKTLMGSSLLFYIAAAVFLIGGASWLYGWYQGKTAPSELDATAVSTDTRVAYVAGGCFWCTESDFAKLEGVVGAVSGYMGGDTQSPSYREVAAGSSGHREIVKVVYDPSVISYKRLALELLRETDPTDAGGSFADRGHQYTSAIYYSSEEEKKQAEAAIAAVEAEGVFDVPIATSVEPAGDFWVAEDYHQDYSKKNPLQYSVYRRASGRDAFIEKYWGDGAHDHLFEEGASMKKEPAAMAGSAGEWQSFVKPSKKELKEQLTELQYYVTQKDGTERPFDNEYWDNHEEGIYVDIVSGEPLFSSTDKYDSGTGWPSFLKPLDPSFVTEHDDYKLITHRTEIRSAIADSHLGHIILDGPESNNFVRYCMNSASLRFVPVADMEAEGYGAYIHLFDA